MVITQRKWALGVSTIILARKYAYVSMYAFTHVQMHVIMGLQGVVKYYHSPFCKGSTFESIVLYLRLFSNMSDKTHPFTISLYDTFMQKVRVAKWSVSKKKRTI